MNPILDAVLALLIGSVKEPIVNKGIRPGIICEQSERTQVCKPAIPSPQKKN